MLNKIEMKKKKKKKLFPAKSAKKKKRGNFFFFFSSLLSLSKMEYSIGDSIFRTTLIEGGLEFEDNSTTKVGANKMGFVCGDSLNLSQKILHTLSKSKNHCDQFMAGYFLFKIKIK